MALIYIDDLLEGMVLAEDLYTVSGRFVLAAGCTLKQDQLTQLKQWGVIEASISDESIGEEYARLLEPGQEFVDRAGGLPVAPLHPERYRQ